MWNSPMSLTFQVSSLAPWGRFCPPWVVWTLSSWRLALNYFWLMDNLVWSCLIICASWLLWLRGGGLLEGWLLWVVHVGIWKPVNSFLPLSPQSTVGQLGSMTEKPAHCDISIKLLSTSGCLAFICLLYRLLHSWVCACICPGPVIKAGLLHYFYGRESFSLVLCWQCVTTGSLGEKRLWFVVLAEYHSTNTPPLISNF